MKSDTVRYHRVSARYSTPYYNRILCPFTSLKLSKLIVTKFISIQDCLLFLLFYSIQVQQKKNSRSSALQTTHKSHTISELLEFPFKEARTFRHLLFMLMWIIFFHLASSSVLLGTGCLYMRCTKTWIIHHYYILLIQSLKLTSDSLDDHRIQSLPAWCWGAVPRSKLFFWEQSTEKGNSKFCWSVWNWLRNRNFLFIPINNPNLFPLIDMRVRVPKPAPWMIALTLLYTWTVIL